MSIKSNEFWPLEPHFPAASCPAIDAANLSPDAIERWLSEPIGPTLPAPLQAKQDAWLRAREQAAEAQRNVDAAVVARDKAADVESSAKESYIAALEAVR